MFEQQINRWIARLDKPKSIYQAPGLPLVLATDIGSSRDENQDRVAAMRVHAGAPSNKSFLCIAVCDGMGGMNNGAESATLALSSFLTELVRQRRLHPEDKLKSAVEHANAQVFNFVKARGGATLSAVLLEDGKAFSVNVGDSRIYLERTDKTVARLERATIDDNLAEAFGGHGNELVQFVGIGEGLSPHIKPLPEKVKSFIITSDGAHFVDEQVFSKTYLNAPDLHEGVERLIKLADWLNGPDNATIAGFNIEQFMQTPAIHEGGGVELWNAFSSLMLMWANKDVQGATPSLPEAQVRTSSEKIEQNGDTLPKKSHQPKRQKKNKKNKKKNNDGAVQQLEIDIQIGEGEG